MSVYYPASMNRRIRKQSAASKSDNGYLRYLRPGALAQLRDSKINARSHLRSYESQISLHRDLSSSPTSSTSHHSNAAGAFQQQEVASYFTATDGELPLFSARFHAPRFPQRKKLIASRSMLYMNHNSNSLTSDGIEPVIDVSSTDILVAH